MSPDATPEMIIERLRKWLKTNAGMGDLLKVQSDDKRFVVRKVNSKESAN